MFIICLTFSIKAKVSDYVRVKDVIVCNATENNSTLPSFTEAHCNKTQINEFSPYKQQVWVKAVVDIPQEFGAYDRPLGLFLSGKMASRVYLNGFLLGSNGGPAVMRQNEIIGKMDAVLYLRSDQVKTGRNEIIILMSGHRSFLKLAYPIHHIAIGPYQFPPSIALQGYLPSFVPFGILLIGAFYFGTVALYRRQEKRYLLLPIAALFAVGQLLAEVSRGLIQYDYPYHDVRLVFILLFATATGMCLLIHIIDRFDCRHKTLVVIASLVITATAIFTEDAFSAKTLRALQVPAVIGVIVAGNAFRLGKSKALNYAISLLIFSIIIQPVLNAFLDIYFFYLVAGLLTYLFVQQIRINELEKQQLAVERSRAERLQQILEENDEKQSPSVIKVSASGRIELIPADKIIYCKSAVDYVELFVEGKGSILRTGSLSELEKELPSVFLRVHRSYVVNSAFVKSLKREPNGAGYLLLATGVEVPVSRRIMPSVRRALN